MPKLRAEGVKGIMDLLISMLRGGLDALKDYILTHTLTCLVPAFFIAGAMSALFPKDKILRYLGEKTKAYISYPISVVAGLFLAVCSCTVLPLFAGIRQRGGGLGPAVAFLYTAPATNILAIIYTGGLIGADLALARIIFSVSFASLIGMILTAVFCRSSQGARYQYNHQLWCVTDSGSGSGRNCEGGWKGSKSRRNQRMD